MAVEHAAKKKSDTDKSAEHPTVYLICEITRCLILNLLYMRICDNAYHSLDHKMQSQKQRKEWKGEHSRIVQCTILVVHWPKKMEFLQLLLASLLVTSSYGNSFLFVIKRSDIIYQYLWLGKRMIMPRLPVEVLWFLKDQILKSVSFHGAAAALSPTFMVYYIYYINKLLQVTK